MKLKTIKSVSIPPEAFVLTLDYLTKATNVTIGQSSQPMRNFVIDSEVKPPLSKSSEAKISANSDWLIQLDKKLVAKPVNQSDDGTIDQSDDFDPFGVLDRKLKKWTTKMFQSYQKAIGHSDVTKTSSSVDQSGARMDSPSTTTATTVTTDWSIVTTTATTVTPAATTSTSWVDQWDDSLFEKDFESLDMSHRLPEYDEMLENFDEGLWENLDLDLSSGDGSKGEKIFKELLDDVTSKNYVIDDDDIIVPDIIEPISSRYVPNQSYDELYDDSLSWNETDSPYDHSGSGDDHYHDGSVPTVIAPILATEVDNRGDDVITASPDESSDYESSTWTDGTTSTDGFETATSLPTSTVVTTTLVDRVTVAPVTEMTLVTDVTVYSDYECDDSDLCNESESGSGEESLSEV